MVDREKAIKQLKWLVFNFPWQDKPVSESDRMCNAIHKYAQDAVDLLKAQEPVEPKIVDTSNSKLYHNDMFKNHYCGNCGEFLHVVNRKDLFCSQCGRAVKWK